MGKIFRVLAVIGVLCGTLFAFTPVNAVTALTKYEYTTATSGTYDVYGTILFGQQFTVGTMPHSSVSVKLVLARVGSPGTVNIQFKEVDGGGNPIGDTLCSGSLNGNLFSVSVVTYTFTCDSFYFNAGQKYAWYISAPQGDGSNYVKIALKYTSGGYAGGDLVYSVDDGASWTIDAADTCFFEIWGYPAISIESAMVYEDYLQNGDMLFLLNYINVAPPYYTTGSLSPGTYFNLRLLQSDGVTLIASTTMNAWGDKPGSIYLSASQAQPITPGDALYLQVYGLYGSHPNVTYQLQSGDWSGDLTGWVLATANNMSLYYSTSTSLVSFTTYATNTYVLNQEGGVIFQTGIPFLMETHPTLFNITNKTPVFVPPPVKTTVGVPQTWQNIFGTSVSGVFTDIGTMVGIDGKYAGAGIVFIVWIALVISVAAKGGTPLIAMAIGIPILFAGVWAALVDFVVVAAAIIVLGLVALIGFWITRT